MALSGHLSVLSLAELIEIFCNQRKSGRLKVEYRPAPGFFYIKDGELLDAILGPFHGSEAVYYALTLPRNVAFDFDTGILPSRHTIIDSWQLVVLEGLRRLDEGVHIPDPFIEDKEAIDSYNIDPDKPNESFNWLRYNQHDETTSLAEILGLVETKKEEKQIEKLKNRLQPFLSKTRNTLLETFKKVHAVILYKMMDRDLLSIKINSAELIEDSLNKDELPTNNHNSSRITKPLEPISKIEVGNGKRTLTPEQRQVSPHSNNPIDTIRGPQTNGKKNGLSSISPRPYENRPTPSN
jgi:hypothetical protein